MSMVFLNLAILVLGIFGLILNGLNVFVIAAAIAIGISAKSRWHVILLALAAAVMIQIMVMMLIKDYSMSASFILLSITSKFGAGCMVSYGIFYLRERGNRQGLQH